MESLNHPSLLKAHCERRRRLKGTRRDEKQQTKVNMSDRKVRISPKS